MVSAFITEAPRLLAVIRSGLDEADAKSIALAAHSLKGSAGYFGADELQALCKEIEALADAGTLDSVRSRLPDLQLAIDAAIAPLQQANHVGS